MRGAIASSVTPIGTLTRNTGRQPVPKMSAETIAPPRTCRTTALPDSVATYHPNARERAAPSKFSWIPLKTCGTSSAALMPWTTRAAMRTPAPGASPHASDAAVKPTRPVRNARRCPQRAPILAPLISSVA
jgi:hypothetical protein